MPTHGMLFNGSAFYIVDYIYIYIYIYKLLGTSGVL